MLYSDVCVGELFCYGGVFLLVCLYVVCLCVDIVFMCVVYVLSGLSGCHAAVPP